VGKAMLTGKTVKLTMACPATAYSCGAATIDVSGRIGGKQVKVGSRSGVLIAPGGNATVSLPLTGSARAALRDSSAPKRVSLNVRTRARGVGAGSSVVTGRVR
jgi:hypothetical protein